MSGDVPVGHHPDRGGTGGKRQDAFLLQAVGKLRRGQARIDRDKDDVRAYAGQIDRQRGGARDAFSQPPGIGMVRGQTVDHRAQRDDPGRSDHAGLPHPAADHLAKTACPLDEVGLP